MAQSLLTIMLLSLTTLGSSLWGDRHHSEATNTINKTLTIDLSEANACDFVYGFDIQAIFDTDNDVVGEERIKVEKLSTCAYHWFNDLVGSEEHLELWLEVKKDGNGAKFSHDLEQDLESGELRHPMKPENGKFTYELIEGPGDMTIWSSDARSLKWHLHDNYYFIINLDEQASPRSAEEDLEKLMTLASQVNERLGLR